MRDGDSTDPILPIDLAEPLIIVAVAVLSAMTAAEVPGPLRSIVNFDARRLTSTTVRRQIVRAVAEDDDFAQKVRGVADVALTTELSAVLTDDGRDIDTAVEQNLIAETATWLWLTRPPGWEYDLGRLQGRAEERRSHAESVGEEQAARRRLRDIESALARTTEARSLAERDRDEARDVLREVRRNRREHEEAAARSLAELRDEVQLAEARNAAGRADLERARVAVERERARAVDAQRAREHSAARVDALEAAIPGIDRAELAALAATAREITSRLDAAANSVAPRREPSAPNPPGPRVKRPPLPVPAKRAAPNLPPGRSANEREAIDSMVRTRDVVVFVDGYNVTRQAWPGASGPDQRGQLTRTAEQLRLSWGCDVVLVFDGDAPESTDTLTRGGVRIIFSAAGEEADDVIVRLVGRLPLRIPVVVVSADRRVQDESSARGAVAVASEAFLAYSRTGGGGS